MEKNFPLSPFNVYIRLICKDHPACKKKFILNLEIRLVGLCHEYSMSVAGPRGTHEEHECGLAKAEEYRPK